MNKARLTEEQGFEAIMEILAKANAKESIKETIYDGRGHAIVENGKKIAVGNKKGRTACRSPKNSLKDSLMDATEVLFSRNASKLSATVGRNTPDGIVIRLADADYCIKVTAHAKPEYAERDRATFKAEKSYITRGKAENHSSAIAKIIVAEIEIENPCASFCGFEFSKPIVLLDARAGAVRIEIENSELTFKITKKRSRVVIA